MDADEGRQRVRDLPPPNLRRDVQHIFQRNGKRIDAGLDCPHAVRAFGPRHRSALTFRVGDRPQKLAILVELPELVHLPIAHDDSSAPGHVPVRAGGERCDVQSVDHSAAALADHVERRELPGEVPHPGHPGRIARKSLRTVLHVEVVDRFIAPGAIVRVVVDTIDQPGPPGTGVGIPSAPKTRTDGEMRPAT